MSATVSTTFDPITFEVVAHRLWSINEEGSTTIAHASGSPVVQATDYNFALYAANGDLAVSGVFYMLPVYVMQKMIKETILDYGDELRPGDVFISNDPFRAGVHQSDVQFVSPFFFEDTLVGWTGCMAHVMDLGGMNPGSWCPTATELVQEGLMIPLQRIVDGGKIIRGSWDMILANSRLPAMLANDFSAMLSSHRVAQTRLTEACEAYGADTIAGVMEHEIDATEQQMRDWVSTLPDGRFEHVGFVDHDGHENNLYKVACTLTKRGDSLSFDFSESDDAIVGFGNATASGTLGAVGTAVIGIFGSELQWNAGLIRPVDVVTRSNSVVSAEPPLPISSGSTGAVWIAAAAATACVAKMLAFRDEYRDFVMGPADGSWLLTQFGGLNQFGEPFAVMFMDSLAWGGPAFRFRDGVDTGGSLAAVGGGFNDVEMHESQYPLLYLWRRENRDSGGAGRHRGGNGIEIGLALQGTDGIGSVCGTQGAEVPTCVGVFGGYPGGTSKYDTVIGSDWRERFAAGRDVDTLDDLEGQRVIPESKALIELGAADVVNNITQNAGGYGDPLERAAGDVLHDVVRGHVTAASAWALYGVRVSDGAVDEAATAAERAAKLAARLEGLENRREAYESAEGLPVLESWGDVLDLVQGPDGVLVAVQGGGAILGKMEDNWRAVAPFRRLSAAEIGPSVRVDERLEVRQYVDPVSGRSLWVDVLRTGDRETSDFVLDLGA
jgi:N-methylhydantoinase B